MMLSEESKQLNQELDIIIEVNQMREDVSTAVGIVLGVYGFLVAMGITWAGWVMYRSIIAMLNEKYKKCGVLDIGTQREACVAHLTISASKKALTLVKKEVSACSKKTDPEKKKKCVENARKAVNKLNENIKKAQEKLSMLRLKHGEKTQAGIEKAKRKEKAVTMF